MTASRIKNATRIMNRIARRARQASQKKTSGFRRILIIGKTAPVRHLSSKNGASSTPFFQDTMRGDFDQASPQDSEWYETDGIVSVDAFLVRRSASAGAKPVQTHRSDVVTLSSASFHSSTLTTSI